MLPFRAVAPTPILSGFYVARDAGIAFRAGLVPSLDHVVQRWHEVQARGEPADGVLVEDARNHGKSGLGAAPRQAVDDAPPGASRGAPEDQRRGSVAFRFFRGGRE